MTEPVKFVKGSDALIEGWGMPFGGPFEGRDFDGEFFSERTDFLFDWFKGSRPLLYQHTFDATVGTKSVGDAMRAEKRDLGIWTTAQLDLRGAYYEAIRELIGKDALSFSSGAYPIGVQVAKSGEIMRWPWVELTLTPTPANPYASLSAMKFVEVPLPEPVEVAAIASPPTRIREIAHIPR